MNDVIVEFKNTVWSEGYRDLDTGLAEDDNGECGCGKFYTAEGWTREHIGLPTQVSSLY